MRLSAFVAMFHPHLQPHPGQVQRMAIGHRTNDGNGG
jgi:hypothetical protein